MSDDLDRLGISKMEKDFLAILPERFRAGAMQSYKEKMAEFSFNSTIEAHKCKLAYMDAFVTAVFMTQEDASARHIALQGGNMPEETAVLPVSSDPKPETKLPC